MKLSIFFVAALSVALFSFSAQACDKEIPKSTTEVSEAAQEVNQDSDKAPVAFDKKPAVGTRATCPVMGHAFKIKPNSEFSEYKGKYYFFCCAGCKPKFDKSPEKYIK